MVFQFQFQFLPYIIGFVLLGIIITGIKIIKQYNRGVKFTLGKFTSVMEPGLNFVIPFIQNYIVVDIRQQTLPLPAQEVMTKDKVNLKIDGVVFFSIEEPEQAILNVVDLNEQLSAKATSELKEIIGKLTMSESLEKRDIIAKNLQDYLKDATIDKQKGKPWGIDIRGVQINNIELPEQLIRAMSKQAEAEREKEARVTKAEGELEASKKFSEAAEMYKENPQALRLRELQTYQEIGTEHNTLMMVIPETMATPLGNWLLPLGVSAAKKEKIKSAK